MLAVGIITTTLSLSEKTHVKAFKKVSVSTKVQKNIHQIHTCFLTKKKKKKKESTISLFFLKILDKNILLFYSSVVCNALKHPLNFAAIFCVSFFFCKLFFIFIFFFFLIQVYTNIRMYTNMLIYV